MSDGIKTNFFYHVYINHANSVVSHHVLRNERDKISRATIELEILKEIDKSNFPLEYRIAFITKVVSSNTFDIYWLGQRHKYSLSKHSITRLRADMDLLDEIESPDPLESDSDGDDDGSSTISDPTSDNFPTSESPPSSPIVHPTTGGKSIASLAVGATSDSEPEESAGPEESPEPESPPKPQPKGVTIPSDGTPWWQDPDNNPFTRYNGNPRPTHQPAAPPAGRSSTPSSESDTNVGFELSESELEERVRPYLTGEAFGLPPQPIPVIRRPAAPVDTTADRPGAKCPRKGKGVAGNPSGSAPTPKKRKVRFDLPEDEDGPEEDAAPASPARKKPRTTRSAAAAGDARAGDTAPASPLKRARTTRSTAGAGDLPPEDIPPASPTKRARTTRSASPAVRGASSSRGAAKSTRGSSTARGGGASARKKPATRGKSPARGGGGAKGGKKGDQA